MSIKKSVVVSQNRSSEVYKNGLKSGQMFGIPIFGRGKDSLLKIIKDSRIGKPLWIATLNPEFVMAALSDKQFFEMLKKRTSVNVVDGMGLVWAGGVLKESRGQRLAAAIREGVRVLRGVYHDRVITGVELMDAMCLLAAADNRTVYFFGGWGDRAKRTAEHFQNKYPGLKVAGYKDEDFDFGSKADFLFVARGMKKQEMWIDENLNRLKTAVVVGVGRSFDYYSGDLKRAPVGVRRMGLEWLYSLWREPKRWRRQLELPKFIWKVLTYSSDSE